MDGDSCRSARRAPGTGAGRSAGLPPRQPAPRQGCGGERVWGSRPFSLVPRASGSGGAGWGRSPERTVAAALARGRSCLYLAAQERAGAVPEGAAQRSARRSADRALPGKLPPAALPSSLRLGLLLALPQEAGAFVLPGRWTGAPDPIAAKGTVQAENTGANCSRTSRLSQGVLLEEARMPGAVKQGC